MASGVYQIHNDITGDFYIGSSKNIAIRKGNQFSELRHNKYCNQYLQRAFNKYGEENFSHHIVHTCELSKLDEYEQLFIDELEPAYNIALYVGSPMRGRKHTPEAVESMRQKLKGRIMTDEHKARISKAHMGKVQGPHSEEHKRKISLAGLGRKHTPESKAKISAANKGRKMSPEVCKRNGEVHSKAVYRVCPDTGEEKFYKSMTEAKKQGFDQTNISRCCRGLQKTYKKYLWRYA